MEILGRLLVEIRLHTSLKLRMIIGTARPRVGICLSSRLDQGHVSPVGAMQKRHGHHLGF